MAFAFIMSLVTACGAVQLVDTREGSHPVVPGAERAARLETTGCGFASGRTASGVAVGGGLVLTVAHAVGRADGVEVSIADAPFLDADVIAIDLKKDLALLRVSPDGMPDVRMASTVKDATGTIEGGAASGTVPYRVRAVVSLSIEEVLGSDRFTRSGYELDAVTATGDSGAGVYDIGGYLIGVVFASGAADTSTWATASSEIADFLNRESDSERVLRCDSDSSRLDVP